MRNLVVATHGHRTYVGASGRYEVEVLASDGSVEQLIRSSHLDLTLTEAHREAYREKQRLRASGGSRQAFEQILGEVPFPEALPPYSRFVVDPEEYLWVRDSQPLGEPDSHTWSVFDPEGGRVSEVTMPPGLQVHMVGTDSVLGVWRDDLAGPYVRLYALSTVSVPHPPTTADPRAGS